MADIKLIALPVVTSSNPTDYYPLEADQGAGVFATSRITLGNLASSVVAAFGFSGGGALARVSSPSFTTPSLGIAAAASIAIGGATIGADVLALTGTSTFNGNIVQSSGTFSFSGSGVLGGISASGTIVAGGASQLGFSGRGVFTSPASAVIQLGAGDAAAPVAQTLGFQNVVAGTPNTNGVTTTIRNSASTGTGLGGNIVFQYSPHGTTGSTQNAWATALTINGDTAAAAFTGNVLLSAIQDASATTRVSWSSTNPTVLRDQNAAATLSISSTVTSIFGQLTQAYSSTPTALTSANIVARTGVVRQLVYQADASLAGGEGHGSLVQIISGRGGVFYGVRTSGTNKDDPMFTVWTGSDGGGYLERFTVSSGGFQHYNFVGVGGQVISPQHALHVRGGNVRVDAVSSPTVCTAALVTSAGNLSAGAYTYKVTYVTAAGETTVGGASNSVTCDASHAQVSLTGIPVSTNSFVTARKIYRTIAGGSAYLLVATINDNATTTFTDNVADVSLGAAQPSVDTSGGIVDAVNGFRQNGTTILTQIGSANLAVGLSAVATGNDSTAIGSAASATGGRNVAIGTATSASSTYAVALGWNCVSTGGVVIGGGITGGPGNTIHIGGLFHNDTLSTAGHTALWTGNVDGHLYFGAAWPGNTAAVGYSNYIHGATPSSGGNRGGHVILTPGLGGSAADSSGSVIFQTAPAGTGTTVVDRVTINGAGTISWGTAAKVAFGTAGAGFAGAAYTQTDSTTAAGTVAAAYGSVFGAVTFATAANAVTITDAYGLYVKDPVQGTNVTLTSRWALGADSARLSKLYILANTGAAICHIGQLDTTNNAYVEIQPVNGSNNVTILTNYITGNGYLGLGAGSVTPQVYINNTGVIAIGGTTSASPAFKKSSATLAFRLADDSADAAISAAAGTFSGTVKTLTTTVSLLPAAATAGASARAFVTDATATTYASTVVGGGANKVPVVSDGTNWKIG